jgi:signal transduction histidine kinase
VLFATLAVAATTLLSWVSYRGVAAALQADFVHRVENLAGTIASQVSPDDIVDVHQFGEDGHGYAAVQVLLEDMRATSQVDNATVLDTARTVIYDCRDAELFHARSPLDSIAGEAISAALAGRAAISPEYPLAGEVLRAGVAPIPATAPGRTAGVVIVEAPIAYDQVLGGLRRDFLLRTLLAALAMAVLAVILIRIAWSSQDLERRLSRSENLAAMGRMTATLAHEIKNPIAIIRGSAERLGKLAPEAQRMADFVVEESDRLSNTVARYLHFARGEEGSGEHGDAVAALDATLDLLEGELRARKVTLERTRGVAAAIVPLDNESLKQVYLNLILNALDAMTDGGRLNVADADRGLYEVAIADTGPGMSADVLKKLGSPFFTTRAKGTGLGLFLARRLIESAGGKLVIESEVGKGTRCIVRLPRREPAAQG